MDRAAAAAPQSDTLIRQLWDPLCLAALNTPTAQASAGLYARVLRDSLGGRREASDLLLPCTDLSALWPDAAARHLTMRYGSTVRQLQPSQDGVVVNQERFDAAVLAVPPAFAARLLDAPLREAGAGGLLDALKSFDYLPIATLNLRLAGLAPARTHDDAARGSARGHLGQWLFDRARLVGDDKTGELAVVASAAVGVAERNRQPVIEALIDQVAEQAARHPRGCRRCPRSGRPNCSSKTRHLRRRAGPDPAAEHHALARAGAGRRLDRHRLSRRAGRRGDERAGRRQDAQPARRLIAHRWLACRRIRRRSTPKASAKRLRRRIQRNNAAVASPAPVSSSEPARLMPA